MQTVTRTFKSHETELKFFWNGMEMEHKLNLNILGWVIQHLAKKKKYSKNLRNNVELKQCEQNEYEKIFNSMRNNCYSVCK